MNTLKKILVLTFLPGFLFTVAGLFICGASSSPGKPVKLVADAKGAAKLKNLSLEVEYTIGYGKSGFDTIIIKNFLTLKLKNSNHVKKVSLFDESLIDYTKCFLIEYSVTIIDAGNNRKNVCSGGNWRQLKPSFKIEDIIIHIMYNEADSTFSCFQDFKNAGEID